LSSDRSKRRKTLELRSSVPSGQLTHAASSSLFNDGNIEAGTLIKEMISTPTRAKKILKKWKNTEYNQTEMSPEEALAYIMEYILEPLMMAIRLDGFLVTHSWHLK